MMNGQMPILVLREGTKRESGKEAQRNNIEAAKAVADSIRSTLGPKGMDKMLVDSLGDIVITNDGATILKEIDIEHPAAKMVVEVSKTQDTEVGDGTTSAVVLAGEFLKQAEILLEQNVHPTVITNGYRIALNKTLEILPKSGIKITEKDDKMLKNIAKTAMTGKNVGDAKDHLSEIIVKAVKSISEKDNKKTTANVDYIKVEKKSGGSVLDTELIDGLIIDKEKVHPRMPSTVKNSKIALINSALEVKKTEIDAKIQITDPSMIQAFLDEEEKSIRDKVDLVKKSGANVIFCQKGIDDLAQHYFAKYGIFAVRRVKKSDMEKLARATGAKIVTNLHDLSKSDMGTSKIVEEVKIGNDDMTFIRGCVNPKSVSILIRGGTEHTIDEVERAMHDGLKVVAVALEDKVAVPGGGATHIELSLRLREFAPSVGGREQLAIEAFANALEIIPKSLAENGGLDAIDTLIELKSSHEKGNKNAGLDVFKGKVVDMVKNNVIEPLRVKTQAIESATEVATMILRIDDMIASRKSEGPPPGMGGGMGGMPPGMM